MTLFDSVLLPGGRQWDDPRLCPHVLARAAASLGDALSGVDGVKGVVPGPKLTLVIECTRTLSGLPNSWSGFTVLVAVR
jgi:hypothetical protein